MRVGNSIGKIVKVDNTNLEVSRGCFARIYMEIDLSKPLIPMVHILGYNQQVDYAGLHQICFDRGQYAHE